MKRIASLVLVKLLCLAALSLSAATAPRPNILLILADDLGFSDLGCYGSSIATPNLDRLAAGGLRFTQFYNAARCCPTRAALLTGLYPHQAGVGHMLQPWRPPSYSSGLGENTATIAELLRDAGYRTYHVGKWHVGGVGGNFAANAPAARNHPMNRGFDRAYGSGGGGNYFALTPLYEDRQNIKAGENFYATDAFTDNAVKFLETHGAESKDKPFFLHLCYTAPHFPLHAKPADIAKYRGKFLHGWDAERERRFGRQKELGLFPRDARLSPRAPEAKAWKDLPEAERKEWDLRMAVYAGMIDCLDQGVGRVLEAVRKIGAESNTLVLFLSDNGASAEFLDSWPNPARGHKPNSEAGTRESHKCLEVGWANAANTPFREHKMWDHEGGISTPLIVSWPVGITARGQFAHAPGHIIDLQPTFLELAGAKYPEKLKDRALTPLPGKSLVPALQGQPLGERSLAWEHEGNRAVRVGDWKLVASFRGPWELYDLSRDRAELKNLAAQQPAKVKELTAAWQAWADKVGVVPWEQLPSANYKPGATYRKKGEAVPAAK
ncbi:MAG: arylsulfatase [Limisphaerales bacterium]|nr:MAG: arylsulfatase [Limisphaerales bacterium]KAG0507782.1 MAG: arylsulfatase [Limisphaerales bacterium]TXT48785.1 MAG: arylsulfatase [Limisphaerales bacterium]